MPDAEAAPASSIWAPVRTSAGEVAIGVALTGLPLAVATEPAAAELRQLAERIAVWAG